MRSRFPFFSLTAVVATHGNTGAGRFLGQMYVREYQEGNVKIREIIDGQQRATFTTTLLSYVLLEGPDSLKRKAAAMLRDTDDKLKLTLRTHDQQFFQTHILGVDHNKFLPFVLEDVEESFTDSQWRIYRMARCLRETMNKLRLDLGDADLSSLILYMLQSCWVQLNVFTGTEAEAHELFVVLNARMVPLCAADTIKPSFTGKLRQSRRETFCQEWEERQSSMNQQHFDQLIDAFRFLLEARRVGQGLPLDAAQRNIQNKVQVYFDGRMAHMSDTDAWDLWTELHNCGVEFVKLVRNEGSYSDFGVGSEAFWNARINQLLFMLTKLPHPWWMACAMFLFNAVGNSKTRFQLLFLTERLNWGLHLLGDAAFVSDRGLQAPSSLISGAANLMVTAQQHLALDDQEVAGIQKMMGDQRMAAATSDNMLKYVLFRLELHAAWLAGRGLDHRRLRWDQLCLDAVIPQGRPNETSRWWKENPAGVFEWHHTICKRWRHSLANMVVMTEPFARADMTGRSVDQDDGVLASKATLYTSTDAPELLPFTYNGVIGGRFTAETIEARDLSVKEKLTEVFSRGMVDALTAWQPHTALQLDDAT